MIHYGTLRDYRFSDTEAAKDDIRGSKVYGRNDEKLGKINDVIFDHLTGTIRYVVIDTGGWLHSKKFIVPPDRLHASAQHEDDFRIDLNKRQIESFPPFNEEDLESEEKWGDYERKYRSRWEQHPVMHRAETDRNITPTTSQMTKGTGATGPMTGEPPAKQPMAGMNVVPSEQRQVTPIRTETELDVEPQGPGRRWTTFEEKLRQRREEIIAGCRYCGTQPSGERLSERERQVGYFT
ncbi:MAG TPA: PRC-barrel domain-containing protein [Terriglobales bacterium]|nr:PRC-barrel domain-containing protein [Terriglobales bacterium]